MDFVVVSVSECVDQSECEMKMMMVSWQENEDVKCPILYRSSSSY